MNTMLRVFAPLSLILFIWHVTNAQTSNTKPTTTSIFGKDVLNRLKNATDFKTFKQILEGIDLKGEMEKANVDTSWIANVKSEDILKIFNLENVWKDLRKNPLSEQALLQSLTKNINTAALLKVMGSMGAFGDIDWQSILKESLATGSIKIPGMSSQVSIDCAGALYKIFEPLTNISNSMSDPSKIPEILKLPAFQMIDSWAKIPSGIFEGNIKWLGSYAECKRLDEARYCTVSATILFQATLYGTCMPKKCSESDVAAIQMFIGKTIIPSQLKSMISFNDWASCENPVEYSTGFIVTIVICAVIMVFILLGTFIDMMIDKDDGNTSETKQIKLTIQNENSTFTVVGDDKNQIVAPSKNPGEYGTLENKESSTKSVVTKKSATPMPLQLFVCFSLLRNVKSVLSTDVPKGAIQCINGIRAISMFWVILGHMYAFSMYGHADNILVTMTELIDRYSFQAIANAYVSVDSFFLLSGLLVAYLTLKRMDKTDGKINIGMYYLHRFIRLTPPYMFVILVWNNVFPYTHRGPTSELARKTGDGGLCNKYWWTNLLFINNFHPKKFEEECLGWSWYLANDMQFYIIAPLILMAMYRLEQRFKKSSLHYVGPFVVVMIGCSICIVIRMILFGVNDYDALMTKPKYQENLSERQRALYVKPYTRISPYLVGILLGYMLSRKIDISGKVSASVKWLGWIIAILLGYAVVYGPYASAFKSVTHHFGETEDILYGGFSSFVWAIAISWMIYACHYGFGGYINRFLSWNVWIPLSRLTFGAYLLHPLVIFYFYGIHERPYHYQDNLMVFDVISNTLLSYVAAFILAVGVEYPVLNLEKVAFKA